MFIQRLRSSVASVMQIRNYAARKGTRERKRKAKVKTEVQKVGFIPHNLRDREKMLLLRESRKFDDSMKMDPIDDVFVAKYYKWIVYPFSEAVQCHKETHHPDMYNKPNANLNVTIELNMQGEKKTRFVENFNRIVAVPHRFDHGEERLVLAFCKTENDQKIALESGAQFAGGMDLIKKIQNGQISLQNFNYYVAHSDILPELVALRGLMKKKFPNNKLGTLDVDMKSTVERILYGINYTAIKDEFEKDFGVIKTVIGQLNMDPKQLEENFATLIKDIYKMKPKRPGNFISRCILWSPPSPEELKVDHNQYLDITPAPVEEVEEEEEVAEQIIPLL